MNHTQILVLILSLVVMGIVIQLLLAPDGLTRRDLEFIGGAVFGLALARAISTAGKL